MNVSWIDLDREFVSVGEDATGAVLFEIHEALGTTIRWEDVLERRCAVILGEAGAGKTAELRERARLLNEAGGIAMFARIEDVAAAGLLGTAMSPADRSRFERWTSSTDKAHLLLDSVDESRLKGGDLYRTLRSIITAVGAARPRLNVTISARSTDWYPDRDFGAVKEFSFELLAAPESTGESKSATPDKNLVFILAPLSLDRIRRLAEHVGADEVQKLIEQVHANNLRAFFDRPLDVIRGVPFWNEHKRLGNLSEVVARDVSDRLKELAAGRRSSSTLSEERVRNAASRLALAARLMQQSAFWLPDEVPQDRRHAIDCEPLLDDFNPAQLSDLLARGLFDEATYGRVRIHHANTQDFLAADALRELRKRRLSHREVEHIFFRTWADRTMVPDHLASVLAWLAPHDAHVFKLALRHSPEHLVSRGDPTILSHDQRREVLRAYVAKYAGRERVFENFDRYGLARFGDAALSEAIRELLPSSQPEYLRELALSLIARGGVTNLAEEALTIAWEADITPHLRYEAIQAVVKTGTDDQLNRLSGLLELPYAADGDILGALLSQKMFPTHISPLRATCALVHVRRHENLITSLDRIVEELSSLCTQQQQLELFRGLSWLLRPILSGDSAPTWLAAAYAMTLADAHTRLTEDELREAMRICARLTAVDQFDAIKRVVESSVSLRRLAIRANTMRYRVEPSARDDTCEAPYVEAVGNDAEWLREDSTSDPNTALRLPLFQILVGLHVCSPPQLEEIARTGDDGNPAKPIRSYFEQWTRSLAVREERSVADRAERTERRRTKKKEREEVIRSVAALRTGEDFDALWKVFVASPAPERTQQALEWTKLEYGEEVALAYRDGLIQCWRHYVLSDEEPCDSHSHPRVLAWAGFAAEIYRGLDIRTLSDADAARAIGLIPRHDKFPEWLDVLAKQRPSLVVAALGPSIEKDFSLSATNPYTQVMQRLQVAEFATRQSCCSLLLQLIRKQEPASLGVLSEVLGSLLELPNPLAEDAEEEAWASFLARKCEEARPNVERCAIWWWSWFRAAPAEGVEFLDRLVATQNGGVTEQFFSQVAREMHPLGDAAHYKKPVHLDLKSLVTLFRIVRIHIPEEEATRRSRSSDIEFRRAVTSWLFGTPGEDCVRALQEIADGERGVERDWFTYRADQRALQDLALHTMSVKEVHFLLNQQSKPPADSRELFRVVLDRLDDIRRNTEDGDLSLKSLVAPQEQRMLEHRVQLLLVNELHAARADCYLVDREPEVQEKKRIDIRLRTPNDSRVVIEIKVLERWTLDTLKERLENQLIGQYMRDYDSRHGIYLLAASGRREKAGALGLQKVVAELESYAEQLKGKYANVEGLAVIGIDFSPSFS